MVSKVRGTFTRLHRRHRHGRRPAGLDASARPSRWRSIDTGDADRDGHLRTNDFFDVEQYPTMTFTSTGITGSGTEFEVTAT